ncbi:MAG: hypothetical protein ORN20_07410 [Candidatus Nanopelagicales bacterium]|jgi:hypothetical protein|nr:hypothetical protein [Candidatus Nanopelagicales bacterium]
MADDSTPGIRGPRGPQHGSGGGPSGKPSAGASAAGGASPSRRAAFERVSFPILQVLHGAPRWLVVITPAILLFVGLVAAGPFRWVGGILLLLTAALLGWLTALSWPRIAGGQRIVRTAIVLALIGLAVLKFIGRL